MIAETRRKSPGKREYKWPRFPNAGLRTWLQGDYQEITNKSQKVALVAPVVAFLRPCFPEMTFSSRLDQVLVAKWGRARLPPNRCGWNGIRLTGLIRKRKSHDRAAINFALHDSRSAVKIQDGFHQSQAQT